MCDDTPLSCAFSALGVALPHAFMNIGTRSRFRTVLRVEFCMYSEMESTPDGLVLRMFGEM